MSRPYLNGSIRCIDRCSEVKCNARSYKTKKYCVCTKKKGVYKSNFKKNIDLIHSPFLKEFPQNV